MNILALAIWLGVIVSSGLLIRGLRRFRPPQPPAWGPPCTTCPRSRSSSAAPAPS